MSDKRVLIIDDMANMRSQLSMTLSSIGFVKLHVVGNIRDALERLTENPYHIILCDYALGDSTNGQQFLEYLRTADLIGRNTIFIMITAEQSYVSVVAASECAPDDYLLKPFTAAEFNLRLDKLLSRQEYFASIDRASDSKNWPGMIIECDKRLAARDKYFFDLCKIKGVALVRANLLPQAEALYREIIAQRPLGWAKLGLARTLNELNKRAEALQLANEILAETPQFMAAYDFLGKLLTKSGDKAGALRILQKAREIAPGTMNRIRELSALAMSTGQPQIAETILRETLTKHRYSPVRQAIDYAVLSRSLAVQGKTDEALIVLQDARKSFSDVNSTLLLGVAESIVQHAAGNGALANAALEKVMSAGDIADLPGDTIMAIADSCFALERNADALRLIRLTVQNNPENTALKDSASDVLIAAGKSPAEAAALIDAIADEVIKLNNEGVRKAQAGQLPEAIALLSEAAIRLPHNLQILGNAALVIALDQVRNGRDAQKLTQCLSLRESLFKQSPQHPKLEQIDGMLRQLKS